MAEKERSKPELAKTKRKKKDVLETVRGIRIQLLSRPRNVFTLPYGRECQEVRTRPTLAALHYQPTRRIALLAVPRISSSSTKYVPRPSPKHWVPLHTLKHMPSKRLLQLAKHLARPSMPRLVVGVKRESLLAKSALFRKNRGQWLELRAAPKKKPKPHKHPFTAAIIVKGKKVFVKGGLPKPPWTKKILAFRKWGIPNPDMLARLAVPTLRRSKYQLKIPKDYYVEIREKNLRSRVSNHIRQLSNPKQLNKETLADLAYNPFIVSKAALKYKATVRIEALALPRLRVDHESSSEDTEAFTVPRRALRAICSKRTAELALPVYRD